MTTKVMVVCGFGLGSSMVLKMTLDDVLAAEGIKDVETFCVDSYTAAGQDYDMVFISPEWEYLFEKSPKPRVVITNFLSQQEVREKGLELIKKHLNSK
jgi:PTS system ascorbate-specific IIB component